MKNWLAVLFSVFILSACSGSGGGGGSTTTYKYQVTGTSTSMLNLLSWNEDEIRSSFYDEQVGILSSSFILKWNEDASGNISGIYTNQSTGESLSVTGTSNGSGREIIATRSTPISGVLVLKLIIAQTGDLSGSVGATLRAYDSGNVQVGSDEAITVTATTEGSDGGGGGGIGTLASYSGLYVGTVTEASNTALGIAVGNSKYCDMNFAGADFKFEFNASYLTMGYSTIYSSGGGAYADVASNADPAAINISKSLGAFSPATLVDSGHDYTGLKIQNADLSKVVSVSFVGAFSGTTTKKFNGTLTLKFDSTSVCAFTLDVTKQ